MVGTPISTLMRCGPRAARHRSASKRSSITIGMPRRALPYSASTSPCTWCAGRTWSSRSAAESPQTSASPARFASSPASRWGTPLGSPVVPLVKISRAGVSASRAQSEGAAGPSGACSGSSTTRGAARSRMRARSCGARDGFRGTSVAPVASAAAWAGSRSGPRGTSIATRSPGCTPSARSRACQPPTRPSSCSPFRRQATSPERSRPTQSSRERRVSKASNMRRITSRIIGSDAARNRRALQPP
jgi:hypothetical protein